MRFVVELRHRDESVEGTVVVDGFLPRRFTGWLELLQILEGVPGASRVSSDHDKLELLNERLGVAESAGDAESLAQMVAPVLAFRRSRGDVVDRPTFLQGVRPSSERVTHIDRIDSLTRDCALVQCIVRVQDEVPNDHDNVRLWIRTTGGSWHLLGWANSPRSDGR